MKHKIRVITVQFILAILLICFNQNAAKRHLEEVHRLHRQYSKFFNSQYFFLNLKLLIQTTVKCLTVSYLIKSLLSYIM